MNNSKTNIGTLTEGQMRLIDDVLIEVISGGRDICCTSDGTDICSIEDVKDVFELQP